MVDSPFVFVGARGVKSIIDDTLPAGAAAITYQVTAVRSKTRGQPGRFTMLLGVAPPAPVGAPPPVERPVTARRSAAA